MTKEEAYKICDAYITNIFKAMCETTKKKVKMSINISPKEAEALAMAVNALRESIKK